MGNLLSQSKPVEQNKKKTTISDKDRAILELKVTRDKLTKYQKQLEKENVKLNEQAKEMVKTNNKSKALMILKIKKYKEKSVADINGQLITVFDMIDKIEWESINIKAMNALKQGTNALNVLHSQMSPEDVEMLLGESEDAINMENEISSLIANEMGISSEEDLELLNMELNELMGVQTDAAPQSGPVSKSMTAVSTSSKSELILPEAPINTILPSVPAGEVKLKVNTNTKNISNQRDLLAS